MKKNIPTYEFVIDDSAESGVKAISIVADPAFQSKLIAFAAVKSQFVALPETKGKKRKVIGLALIPNTPVFRIDELTGEEYYGFFSADTIEKIVEKFHAENNNNNLNFNHNDNAFVDAVLVEDFIVDSQARVEDLKEKGITHENIMGSWCTTYKIMNPQVFEAVLQGGSKVGFSVEAFLDKVMVQMTSQINKSNLNKQMKKNNKSLLDKIIEIFSKELFDRALVPDLAITIEWGAPGETVNQVTTDDKGNETLAPVGKGEYSTDAGIVVVDDNSKLVEVRPAPSQEAAPVEEAKTKVVPPDVAPVEPDSGKTATEEMKAYPWDQCISDQKARGYSEESANKICGYIKSKYNKATELSDEELTEALAGDECLTCKKKKMESEDDSIKLEDEIPLADPSMMPTDQNPTDQQAPVSPDVKSKTIGELIGTADGDYEIYVCVENGAITKAEVSSETNLMKAKLEAVEKENADLKAKLAEPIGEPILEPVVEKKDWDKMSKYEKVMYKRRLEA
jgi:hypothetical protein